MEKNEVYTYTYSTSSGGGMIESNLKVSMNSCFEYGGFKYRVIGQYDEFNFIVERI